jgi:hypothetical protein
MLTRAIKPTIPATLTVKGQGADPIKFNVNFHNRKSSEVEAIFADGDKTVADVVLFLIESWESEYPLTTEGIREMEDDRPGMANAILSAYGEARQVAKEKN